MTKPKVSTPGNILRSILILLITSNAAWGQLISLKTIPVATGDQFLIFPSQNLGMGGVHIALDDSLNDHWVNPAKGDAIQGLQVTSSPVYYRIGNGYGSARSMPFSIVGEKGAWHGGASFALQAMNTANNNQGWWVPEVTTLNENVAENRYLAGFIGRDFGNTSLGLNAYWASLSALDGVDLLYANSESIHQEGDLKDIRVGLTRKFESGGEVEILYLWNELDMKHEVMYMEWGPEDWLERMEINLDHTLTQGLHIGQKSAVDEFGWSYGTLFTVNQKTHPKIPNYEIMNIPRDPGNTLGFNLGGGLSKINGNSTFGIDVIYEPIKSNTWAEADTFLVSEDDELIRPGDKTVENFFDFSNWILRTGLGWQKDNMSFQLGMQMRTIHYWLDQTDFVAVTERSQEEYWVEWTTTWGFSMNFEEFTIRYNGKTTMGTGRPGVDTQWWGWRGGMLETANVGGDFIIAPSDELTLQEARVMTHQISVSLPIRR